MSQIVKAENIAIQSGLAAGTFMAVDKLYFKQDGVFKKGALVAGSHISSSILSDYIIPMISSNSIVNSTDKTFVQPIVSGGLYSVVSSDKVLGIDYRSWLFKWIFVGTCSAVGNYLEQPVASFFSK